jgi:undecaprenyl-diphosphatase
VVRQNARVHPWQAIVLGVVEGLTEFLPVSSTGHLTVVESAMGFKTNDKDVTAFTAIIQIGAILAVLLFLRADVKRIVQGWVGGVVHADRRTDPNYRFGWLVILGTVPIAIVGIAFQNAIEDGLRSLYWVGGALIAFSAVLAYADRVAARQPVDEVRGESDIRAKDALIVGIAQCVALIPGVSRSGATMSAGLFRGFDRVTVTRLSFFLSIPALVAAGLLEVVTKYHRISDGVGWGNTLLAMLVSFVVGYVSVAWLLRYVARHTYGAFIAYRLVAGVLVLALLAAGVLHAT